MGRAPHGAGSAFEREEDIMIARDALEKTDIAHLSRQPVTRLSGGERQRVHIARALAQQPHILLLDEPNAHLDIAHQVGVFNLIRQMNVDMGLTVLAVSHDLNLAAAYADRIAVLSDGELTAIGRPDNVFTEETIRSVFRTEVLIDTHPHHLSPRVTLLGEAPVDVKLPTELSLPKGHGQ
jgi:iron complex transport system ATP-binding protein